MSVPIAEDTATVGRETRKVYLNQHRRVADNAVAMKRFLAMFTEEYFQVPKGFFRDKKILDAGCGNTIKSTIRFYEFGSRDITGIDLGEEFVPEARKTLQNYNVPDECVKLEAGDVTNLQFDDETFDFVCCHGVLIHLTDLDQMKKGFSELARVTKKGGHLYTVYGGYGGVIEDAILPALREYYRKNEEFREFIDGISEEDFQEMFEAIRTGMDEHTGEKFEIDKKYFDTDFCVTMQNLLQVPHRHLVPPEFVVDMYEQNGFENPTRLKRFIKRGNIRKFLAPLHYARENLLSKLLYGVGHVEYIGKKQ